MKQKYEFVVVLKALLPEDVRLSAQSKIEGMIKTDGGVISKLIYGERNI